MKFEICTTGDKVRVAGAGLVAGQQTDALEAANSTLLKLHYNGTHKCSQSILLSCACLCSRPRMHPEQQPEDTDWQAFAGEPSSIEQLQLQVPDLEAESNRDIGQY